MKVDKDLFVWKIISYPMATQFFYQEDSFTVYILHDDDTESMVESEEDLYRAHEQGYVLGIEVGQLDFHDLARKQDIVPVFWGRGDILPFILGKNSLSDEEVSKVLNNLEQFHDAEIGVNWDVIKCQIQMVIDERIKK